MNVIIEQSKMPESATKITYQSPFPLKERCRRCKGEAILMMLVEDDTGLLINQRPKDVKVWPHDCSVTAIYLCTECGRMRASWNQG